MLVTLGPREHVWYWNQHHIVSDAWSASLICERMSQLYRQLAYRGATVVTAPAAFTAPTGRAHWESLLRARAIENQVYVLAANQFGATPHGFEDYGHSMAVGPWGDVLGCAPTGEAIVHATIDLDHLTKVRREMPCLEHARLR